MLEINMESRKSFRILKFKKSKPVLKISGISKSYGHRLVLKKIKNLINIVIGYNKMEKSEILFLSQNFGLKKFINNYLYIFFYFLGYIIQYILTISFYFFSNL